MVVYLATSQRTVRRITLLKFLFPSVFFITSPSGIFFDGGSLVSVVLWLSFLISNRETRSHALKIRIAIAAKINPPLRLSYASNASIICPSKSVITMPDARETISFPAEKVAR